MGLEDEPFLFWVRRPNFRGEFVVSLRECRFLFLKKLLDEENFHGKESHLENLHVLEETLYFDDIE